MFKFDPNGSLVVFMRPEETDSVLAPFSQQSFRVFAEVLGILNVVEF